jgi:hypothetical protein
MKSCSGVPVYRVCPKTKDYRGEGATGYCIECNRKTNTFCIVCKKWLCNISLAANRGPPQKDKNKLKQNDPKFISITFDDGTLTGKPQKITHVGTSLIKLVLKQKEPWYEDSMAMKTVKFLEQNILFFDTLLHFFVFCFVLRSNVLIMICYSIVVYNVKKG